MKKYQIAIEWAIKDTRGNHYGFRTGNSVFLVEAKNRIEAINEVIESAKMLPEWELNHSGIDLNDYREGNGCRYHYETGINRILSVKAI